MDNQKTQVAERLKQANNILVTVSSNPSVDQLAACIGLTLALNKMGKHATAVFSGNIPSTIEFLQPEKTLEKNTNSLQDFIIALDKSKADKLRYKVEDRVVKIFITPYRTSISDKDLEFSQGDFNVDVVLALGVHKQSDLDQAITSHGRILHDATVMTINTAQNGELGSLNWTQPDTSSLSEQGVELINALDQKLIDGQIATAFLTGIVAETDRFSNQRTTPQTMSLSAELMSLGANQQLVATKLEEPVAPPLAPSKPLAETEKPGEMNALPPVPAAPAPAAPAEPPKPKDDGTIEITHEAPESQPAPSALPPVPAAPSQPSSAMPLPPLPAPEPEENPEQQAPQIHIDDQGRLHPLDNQPTLPKLEDELPALPPVEKELPKIKLEDSSRLMTEPPTFETPPLTANAEPEQEDKPTSDPLSLPQVGLLNREPLSSHADKPAPAPFTAAATGPLPGSTPLSPSPQSAFGNGQPMPAWNTPAPTASPAPMANPMNMPPAPSGFMPPTPSRTLSQIEQDVNSPHISSNDLPTNDTMLPPNPPSASGVVTPTPSVGQPIDTSAAVGAGPSVSDARDAVSEALSGAANQPLEPIKALNAQPMEGGPIREADQATMPGPNIVAPNAAGAMPPAAPPAFGFPATPPPVAMPNGPTPPQSPPPMMPPAF